ncbi:hypothetical protein [Nocardia terpenica]|uniref:Uncharacterized protein n=1 Tax=Nocardia terpenica TaxID=455432 RepID=A0A291RQH5_9NOCA|nr:hypothetical protein [Nocardia terpenica]ATL69871.1 hypothetical protein CRH09_30560 [Nocardia terpenica]
MFVLYPHDRADLSIDLPGVDADRYRYAFKRLDSYAIRDYPRPRIFYSEVAWTAHPDYTDATATITLYAGGRDRDTRARVIKPYQVVIDWSAWDTRLRNALQREITTAQRQAREYGGSSVRSWMFFLASQDRFDPSLFRLDHHAYYCFVAARIVPSTDQPNQHSQWPRKPAHPASRRSRTRRP